MLQSTIRYNGRLIPIRRIGDMSPDISSYNTDLASPPITENDIEENGKTWKVTKEQLLQNFLLFTILMMGMTVKVFHRKWAEFMLKRKRSLILGPRDHGKSWILTVSYVVWRIIKDPNIRILIIANSAEMSRRFVSAVGSHLERNKLIIGMFGKFLPAKWSNDGFTVIQRTKIGLPQPTLSGIGVYGSMVSGHYDLVICEDIVDFENSRTKNQRDKLWDWFWTVVFPTVETDEKDSSKEGELGFRGTRYHYDDFYGRSIGEVEKYKPGWLANDYIRSQAIQGNNQALWPERKSHARLVEIKRDMGSVMFALQYQNDASLTVGRIFGPSYFTKTYDRLPDAEDIIVLAGFDLAVSQKEDADFFAETDLAIHRKTKDIYLIDVWQQHLTAPKQFDAIKASHAKYQWSRGGVENVAYQEAMVQWLKQNTSVPVKGIPRSKDKVTRAYKIVPHFENGKFYMPQDRKFPEFIDQMMLFPDDRHDDMFDSTETAIDLGLGAKSSEFKYYFL